MDRNATLASSDRTLLHKRDEHRDHASRDTGQQHHSNHTTAADHSSVGKYSALQPFLKIPTNDRTSHLTFRWTVQNTNSTTRSSILYGSYLISTPSALRIVSRYYMPKIMLGKPRPTNVDSNVGITIGRPERLFVPYCYVSRHPQVYFTSNFPGQLHYQDSTVQPLKVCHINLSISNLTAGYPLFKAPRKSYQTRFLQSLRMCFGNETPYSDVLFFQRTPNVVKTTYPHYQKPCPNSKLLTGRHSALYLFPD